MLCCASSTHTSPSDARPHLSNPWEETELAASHRPSRDNAAGRQAGEQLYYSSGMAGSAEGEALTPILMRLRSAVTKRMQEDEAETISQLAESILPHGNPPLSAIQRKKSDLLSSLSISILSTFETFLTNPLHTKHSKQHIPDSGQTSILLLQEQQPPLVS